MFKFLKDKLKGALNIFSKKVDEEGKTTEEVVEKKVPVKKTESKKVEKKKDSEKKENKKVETKKEEKKTSPKVADKKKDVEVKKSVEKKEVVSKQKEEKSHSQKVKEEKKSISKEQEDTNKEEPQTKEEKVEEKKGFFASIASVFHKKEEIAQETKEEASDDDSEEAPDEEVETKKEVVVEEDTQEESESNVEETTDDEVVEEEKEPEKKKGFFASIAERITKKSISQSQFEELFFDLELILLENNVAVQVIEKIKADLAKKIVDTPIKRSDILSTIQATLRESIEEVLDVKPLDVLKLAKAKKPYIIAFIGVNGAGKTTTLAKMAHYFQKNKLSVVIAACDTFRAAAIQQLEEHATKLNVKIIKHDYGADATAVAFDAVAHAKSKNIDIVLIDTAGRLHSNSNLMDELAKIERVIKPDLKVFIGESVTGNDCIEQATQFNEKIGIDGIVLSKADVDEKGGAAISVSYVTGKPILFIGTGQTYDDLEPFSKEKILQSLDL